MNPSQSKTAALPKYLYHGTSSDAVSGILKEGLRERSYFSTEPVARWFAEQASREGRGEPIVIRVPSGRLTNPDVWTADTRVERVKRLLPGSLSGVKDIRIWRCLHSVPVTEADIIKIAKTAWEEVSIEGDASNLLGGFLEDDEEIKDWAEQHEVTPRALFQKLLKGRRVAVIDDMRVFERGRGYGTKLLTGFIQRAEAVGCDAIVLAAGVFEKQREGFDLVEWYERYGFQTIGKSVELPLMVKWLKSSGKTATMNKQAETDILVGDDDGDESTAYGDVIPTNELGKWFERYAVLGYEPFLRRIQQKHAKIATLEGIEVEDEARGKGVGDKLLRNFFNEARSLGATAVILVADLGAKQQAGFDLLTWYKKRGFERLGVRSVYPVMMLEFSNVKKAAKADEEPAKNATTQINVPEEMAWRVQQAAKHLIPVEDLAGDGYEKHSHITLRYGLLEDEDAT